jgi:hypothetical protein
MMRQLLLTFVFALAALLAVSSVAPTLALAAESKCGDDTQRKGKIKTEKRGNVVVIVEALVICGKVPKPLALVFMSGSTINYEWENTKPDFLKRVHDSLSQSPF